MKKIIVFILFAFFVFFSACNKKENYILTYYKTADSNPITICITNGTFKLYEIDNVREGYNYLGLFDSPSGGTQIVSKDNNLIITFNKSMSLYAQWEPKKYDIVFSVKDGELNPSEKSIEYDYDSNLTYFPVPTKEGYDFLGWKSKDGVFYTNEYGQVIEQYNKLNFDYYKITEGNNIILYPEWSIKKSNVTFDYNDGTYRSETILVSYGTKLESNDYPNVDTGSKKIIGWSTHRSNLVPFSGIVLEDVTLYAIWTEYKTIDLVIFEDKEIEKLVINQNESIELPIIERNGYVFGGWFDNPLFNKFPITSIAYGDCSKAYYAKMIPYEINIEFDYNNPSSYDRITVQNNEVDNQHLVYEESYDFPNPSCQYFNFLGWEINGKLYNKGDYFNCEIDPNESGSVEITAVARWEKASEELIAFSFDSNDREVKVTSESAEVYDTISPNMNRDMLLAYGYTTLTVYIALDLKENWDGYQHIKIYSKTSNNKVLDSVTYDHGGDKINKDWKQYTPTFTLSLTELNDDCRFAIAYTASGVGLNTWFLGRTRVDLIVS